MEIKACYCGEEGYVLSKNIPCKGNIRIKCRECGFSAFIDEWQNRPPTMVEKLEAMDRLENVENVGVGKANEFSDKSYCAWIEFWRPVKIKNVTNTYHEWTGDTPDEAVDAAWREVCGKEEG